MAKTRRLGNFTETNEKVEFTFMGWDGTGYNGEGKTQKVWRIVGDDQVHLQVDATIPRLLHSRHQRERQSEADKPAQSIFCERLRKRGNGNNNTLT